MPTDLKSAAALLGAKGGAAGKGAAKRRDVDYAALGRKGGLAGKGKRKRAKRKDNVMKMILATLSLTLATVAVADDSQHLPPDPPAWVVVVTYRDAERVVQQYERLMLTAKDARRWADRTARRGFCREWQYGIGGAEIACYPAHRVIEVVARQR